MSRSSVVEKNFSAAASTYDSAASFQRIAAGLFADFIAAMNPGARRLLPYWSSAQEADS